MGQQCNITKYWMEWIQEFVLNMLTSHRKEIDWLPITWKQPELSILFTTPGIISYQTPCSQNRFKFSYLDFLFSHQSLASTTRIPTFVESASLHTASLYKQDAKLACWWWRIKWSVSSKTKCKVPMVGQVILAPTRGKSDLPLLEKSSISEHCSPLCWYLKPGA